MRAVDCNNLSYQSGFGNEFATESIEGALPKRGNSPQRSPHGLYSELLSGTAFTAPRDDNLRSWLYRIRPSVVQKPFERIKNGLVRGTPFAEEVATPNQLRWDALPMPDVPTDFINGLVTMAGGGDSTLGKGLAVHIYLFNQHVFISK